MAILTISPPFELDPRMSEKPSCSSVLARILPSSELLTTAVIFFSGKSAWARSQPVIIFPCQKVKMAPFSGSCICSGVTDIRRLAWRSFIAMGMIWRVISGESCMGVENNCQSEKLSAQE